MGLIHAFEFFGDEVERYAFATGARNTSTSGGFPLYFSTSPTAVWPQLPCASFEVPMPIAVVDVAVTVEAAGLARVARDRTSRPR
jgi:hypothetical protein